MVWMDAAMLGHRNGSDAVGQAPPENAWRSSECAFGQGAGCLRLGGSSGGASPWPLAPKVMQLALQRALLAESKCSVRPPWVEQSLQVLEPGLGGHPGLPPSWNC